MTKNSSSDFDGGMSEPNAALLPPVDGGGFSRSRRLVWSAVGVIVTAGFFVGLFSLTDHNHHYSHHITSVFKSVFHHHRHHHHHHSHTHQRPINYTAALGKALRFFNAQKSGKLPKNNNVPWRGDSCLNDGYYDEAWFMNLTGGYYDGGDAVKFNFPSSFAMTMLSWSVIEYSAKYEAAEELSHVKETIKWGTDYILRTFNSSADTIDRIVSQVGIGDTSGGSYPNDHYCWMRPKDINYDRPLSVCASCSDLAAEMAAALASASIVFKDNTSYSKKLVHGARTLFKFARSNRGRYSAGSADASIFYNSTSYWDEFIWGASWLYYATGNSSYLQLATARGLAKHAGAFLGGPGYGVLSWDNKLLGAQVLLTRLGLFMSPGYPYEDMIQTFHEQTNLIMCSYLPYFRSFRRTKGGLIELNHGRPQDLQYVVNAAFLATLYSDYLVASGSPGWYCGPNFYSVETLRKFAKKQMDYILGKNPRGMSYVVGFSNHYPKHVHHRGASIPNNKKKYKCREGWKWRDISKPNPNTIVGAMVAGPDKHDGFHDVRNKYDYTEPTLAGNAGLVAALVALSGNMSSGIDIPTMFSAVPPFYTADRAPAEAPFYPADLAPAEVPFYPADLAPVQAPFYPADLAPAQAPFYPADLAPAQAPFYPADLAPAQAPFYPADLAPSQAPFYPADLAPPQAPFYPADLAPAEAPFYSADLAPAQAPFYPADLAPAQAPFYPADLAPTQAPFYPADLAPPQAPFYPADLAPSQAPFYPADLAPTQAPFTPQT